MKGILNKMDRQSLINHRNKFKFTREGFIHDIRNFHAACIENGEKGLKEFKKIDGIRVSIETLYLLSDEPLIKIHKWFWDSL